jgi:hypothetical protein
MATILQQRCAHGRRKPPNLSLVSEPECKPNLPKITSTRRKSLPNDPYHLHHCPRRHGWPGKIPNQRPPGPGSSVSVTEPRLRAPTRLLAPSPRATRRLPLVRLRGSLGQNSATHASPSQWRRTGQSGWVTPPRSSRQATAQLKRQAVRCSKMGFGGPACNHLFF